MGSLAAKGSLAATGRSAATSSSAEKLAESSRSSDPVEQVAAQQQRNIAVDVYRGFVMILMMAEVLQLRRVALNYPNSAILGFLGFQQTHVPWVGMSLHDTIQPGFTFLVGAALPYSIRSRQRKGQSFRHMLLHTIWRSFLLIALGIFLRSLGSPMLNFTFEDTLTQIGLGYTFGFLLTMARPRWQWVAFSAVLFGCWLAWALYPAPGPNFDWAAVGVTPDFRSHIFTGFAAHWNKNSNLGQAFDLWFLNLFPRPSRFLYNDGGYLTLSFIPTLGTMLMGVLAGRWFHESAPRIPLRKFLIASAAFCAAGLLLHFTGICPIVKRIWTPSWTLFSGGVCFLYLAAFCWLVDIKKFHRAAFPFVVVGMNSIAAYVIAEAGRDFVEGGFRTLLGTWTPHALGSKPEALLIGILTLVAYWLILYWMFRKRIFVRI
jgi:heparan-alpha-glucosaminide N-acetyltransferase